MRPATARRACPRGAGPKSVRRRARTSSAMRRYVVSFPPATLSMPAGLRREDRLAPCRRGARRHRPAARAGPRTQLERVRRASCGGRAPHGPRRESARPRPVTARRSRVRRRTAVRRTEQQHVVPGDGEGDPHVVLGDRERRAPRARSPGRARGQPRLSRTDVPASGSSRRRTRSTHGPAALTTTRASTATTSSSTRTSAPTSATRGRAQSDDLGAVQHARRPHSAAARTLARQRRVSFVVASA